MSRKALADYRIERAKEILVEAEDTLKQKHYKLSVNRSYYAMFTAAKATGRWITTDLFQPVMALTYYLLRLLIEIPGGIEEAPGVALTLLLMIMIFNGIAFIIRSIYEKKKQW